MTTPVIINGATSPVALEIAKISPVSIPGKDVGIIIFLNVSHLVAPNASEPSLMPFETAFKLYSVATITTGTVRSARVKDAHNIPPVP